MQADAPQVEHERDADTNAMRNRALRFRAEAIGKGRLLTLGALDKRTSAYRKCAELIDSVEADLGGADRLSTAQQQIIRHAAVTGAMIDDLGARWLAGEPIDPAAYSTLCNSERRLYEAVGLDRRARDVTTLGEILQQRSGQS